MSLNARSDPHSVYATVLRGFGLTRSELPPPHGGTGEVTTEGVGEDLVAAGVADPYETLLRTLVRSDHGVEAPRRYWSEAPAEHLAPALAAFGYEFALESRPDGDGRTVGALLSTGESTRRMTYTYPEDGDGADNYPALVHAIQTRLLPEAGPTFVRLADDGDSWRFALVERWRLAELQELFGKRLEVFGDPLLAAHQPANLFDEGDRDEVESVDLPTETLADAFGTVRRAALSEPVTPTGDEPVTLDLDPDVAAVLQGVGVDLADESATDFDADPGRTGGEPTTADALATGTDEGDDRPETGAGSLWSDPDPTPGVAADDGVDRPDKRYTADASEEDGLDDRDRFVPSDPPDLGGEAARDQVAESDSDATASPFDQQDDTTAHRADDATGAVTDDDHTGGATVFGDTGTGAGTTDRDTGSGADRATASNSASAADGAPGTDRDASGGRAGTGEPVAPTAGTGGGGSAGSERLSDQVASTLGDAPAGEDAAADRSTERTEGSRSGAASGRESGAVSTTEEQATESTATATTDQTWTDDDAEPGRVNADVLSTITEWIEGER